MDQKGMGFEKSVRSFSTERRGGRSGSDRYDAGGGAGAIPEIAIANGGLNNRSCGVQYDCPGCDAVDGHVPVKETDDP
jgi:hypothetical protein